MQKTDTGNNNTDTLYLVLTLCEVQVEAGIVMFNLFHIITYMHNYSIIIFELMALAAVADQAF